MAEENCSTVAFINPMTRLDTDLSPNSHCTLPDSGITVIVFRNFELVLRLFSILKHARRPGRHFYLTHKCQVYGLSAHALAIFYMLVNMATVFLIECKASEEVK